MTAPSATPFKACAQLIVVVGTALMVAALACRSKWLDQFLALKEVKPKRVLLASGGVDDAPSGRALLRQEQPDWVLIGNSMLNSRIETEDLKQLSGRTPFKLSASGTKSPMWFLFLKLVVAESGVKPKCVTVFFRDRDLTWPELRMTRNEEMIARMGGRDQPEWAQVMGRYDAAVNLTYAATVKRLATGLETLLPGEKLRLWGRQEMQKQAFHFTNFGHGILGSVRRNEMNERLSFEHQRQAAMGKDTGNEENESDELDTLAEEQTEPLKFDPAPSESFLPHMVALAQQQGFKLHFHRIKRRPDDPEDTKTDASLAAYLQDLANYLKSEGCLFTDESTEREITADMFVDGDHINDDPAYQRPYLARFWHCVQPTLQPVFTAP
jgi:hypothetical protein